jgi:hypothetical protein
VWNLTLSCLTIWINIKNRLNYTCLRRAPEKYITGAALDRAAVEASSFTCKERHYVGRCRRLTCSVALRKGRIRLYRAAVVQELQPPDMKKKVVSCCQLLEHLLSKTSASWTYRGVWWSGYADLRRRSCELLLILVPFMRNPCIDIKVGDVLCSVTCPHSCSHFLSHDQLRWLPRHFTRIRV